MDLVEIVAFEFSSSLLVFRNGELIHYTQIYYDDDNFIPFERQISSVLELLSNIKFEYKTAYYLDYYAFVDDRAKRSGTWKDVLNIARRINKKYDKHRRTWKS